MSFTEEAARRRSPWLWAAAGALGAACVLLPYRPLLVTAWPLVLLPAWLLLGHLLTAFSYVITSQRWSRGLGLWRSSWSVYGENRSSVHLQAALAVSVIEELIFRYGLQSFLQERFASALLSVLATSVLFAALHVRSAKGPQARRFIDTLLLALVLGSATALTASIYPAILLHATRNYILRCLLVSKAEYQRQA